MPGRYNKFDSVCDEIAKNKVVHVICLAPIEEIRKKSAVYQAALERGVPWNHVAYPISDYSVPNDRVTFLALAGTIAKWLRAKENVLIHCGAGIGRTGTLAVAVLLVLDQQLPEAVKVVKGAGSCPETKDQLELLQSISDKMERS